MRQNAARHSRVLRTLVVRRFPHPGRLGLKVIRGANNPNPGFAFGVAAAESAYYTDTHLHPRAGMD